MENKKLHKYIWREESRLKNSNILNDNDGKCLFLNSSDKKIERIELLDRKFSDSNINSKESIVKKNFGDETNKTYSTEITKESHFECEEEWNIGGIPELLNELDADIEKSLTNIHVSNIDGAKHANGNRKEVLKQLQSKFICQEETTNNILRSDENLETTLNLEKINAKPLNSGNLTSTFAGFSKGGNLISSNSHTSYSSKISDKFNQRLKQKKYLNVNNCTISMSSQTGSNIISGSNISGPANNVNNSQASSGSNSNKQNKMSIDHQATLDKGLKMKIKRTKPGTKSSEAKHEIVKATEQLQNGLTASSTCTATQDDNSSLMSVSIQSTSSISQNSNVLLGASNNQGSNNSISNKKNLGSCINHSNIAISPSNNSSSILHNTSSANSVSQSTSQSAKRGSSGHRRDKVKEKPSHSNRSGLEKSSSTSTDKEQNEKTTCQCSAADNSLSVCSNSICTRKTESNTQRISNSNSSTIPPGVFTPSTETSNTVTVSTASPLTVTTTVSTTVSTQSLSLSGSANSPGPPSKDIITNSNNNIKISSHIAAQLAAAAASNNSSNGSNISASNYLNSDLKIPLSNASNQVVKQTAPGLISTTVHQTLPLQVPNSKNVTSVLPAKETGNSNSYIENSEPPTKRTKLVDSNIPSTSAPNTKEMTDICVGTSVGTITDPDCLGPCEPGTSVTLEGIVWHETEGGVLVVNVTWRGKTYVGTLLDCTRHDWAPPRFCDSPTEDLESRTPKGRGKRGRAAITPDLSNFTETRSSIYFSHSHVHSKLRNGSAKNGRGASRTLSVPPPDKINTGSSLSSGNGGSTPSTSPTAFLPPRLEKRKSKDDSSPSPVSVDNEIINNNMANASGISIPANIGSDSSNQPQSLINPVTGLNVQISTKKFKTSPCAISPVLIECPEQDCSKKYTHVNGLRYHQSHAHGSTSLLDEDSIIETEEQITTPIPSPLSSTPSMTPNPIESVSNTQSKTVSQITTGPLSEDSNVIIKDEEALISQLEQTEKPTTSSEPLKTESSSTVSPSTVFSSGGSITAGTPNNGPKKQFDLISNTKVNLNTLISTESNTQEIEHQNPTGKSGLLLLGQGETKHNSSANITEAQTIAFESDRKSSDLSENDQHNADNESYCPNEESSSKQKQAQQNQSHQNVCSSKVSLVCKAKKNRKSPTPPDFDSIDLNTCNIIREDVQSPAYSDISDDSTPVNEQDSTDKQNSKSIDVIKKTQEIGITTGINPSNSQNNVSSTLGNYGVYQFYQQQQFIVPTTAEQQLSGKGGINSNIANTAISSNISQQHNISELTNKKDSSVDVISKANQLHSNQSCLEMNKEATRQLGSTQENNELQPLGSGALPNSTQSKAASHFYAFNYMPSNYPFNVEPNYAPNPSISATEDVSKVNRLPVMNSNDQQHLNAVLYKDDRLKEDASPTESAKLSQVVSKQNIKSDAIVKSESIKQEISCNTPSPMSQHVQIQTKDQQAIGAYPNVYQRHSLTLASQQLSRDEELRRYYIFSDQQRRQNNTQNILNQVPNSSTVSGNQNSKDDTGTSQLNNQHNQIKIKSGSSVSIVSKSGSTLSIAKESPKHKPEEDLKVIKQEGQKPTMETQGPPPPPTSQYFLHPSYIASTPFGFDPSHSMYRNVLMSATSPYNTPPYHLPIPRYHSPEDLSRNTGTKALDALHHAASQYYTTHKIHELSERALKSPNSTNPNNGPIAIKMGGTSSNIGTTQHSNLSSAIAGHHTLSNQPTSGNQLPHNLAPQAINISSKQDVISSKPQGNGSSMSGSSVNESQKQSGANTSLGTSSNSNNVSNVNSGNVSDSRSPPPQRHVHTHHHTHVGLGYPMYPAPYGAAVLASQQAAAVAVINPFPPGPNK